MRNVLGDYYVGLDIGTDSVGWAVSDPTYKILKYKGNAMWGVSLFDAAEQSAERRAFRTARRRLDRRQQRILLLQELFAKEIEKKDSRFFQRIKESALHAEDKTVCGDAAIFGGDDYTDEQYHKDYPTIHHLIYELMNNKKPHDVRLVYLACAYLLAHRGHFLFEVEPDNVEAARDIGVVLKAFYEWFDSNEIPRPFECDAKQLSDILSSDKRVSIREKRFKEELWGGKNPDKDYPLDRVVVIKLISGGKAKLSKLFLKDEYKELKNDDIFFGKPDFDEVLEALYSEMDGSDAELVKAMKSIYDCALLNDKLKGYTCISEAKIAIYEQHKKNLKLLKDLVRKYVPNKYYEVFRKADDKLCNYTKYSANLKSADISKLGSKYGTCTADEFYSYIKGVFKGVVPDDEDKKLFEDMFLHIETLSFCPKQVSGENRVIPYQLYYYELNKVLENAESYLPFLLEKDEYGTVSKKILSIMTFRIPYYVGPLVNKDNNKNAWIVRKGEGRILPWNMSELVDMDKSENEFIRRMTSKCSYVAGEDVLPKNSLLYTKYTVLNEINNIRINGERISTDIKQGIYNEVFLRKNKPTIKDIKTYLTKIGAYTEEVDILDGIDISVKSSLKPHKDFCNMLSNGILTEEQVEAIIERITATTDKLRLKKWLRENYNLCKSDIDYISKLNYSDYGRLSEKLLAGIKEIDPYTGEICGQSIIEAMWDGNENLMELLSSRHGYMEQINRISKDYYDEHPSTIDERLNEMYIPTAVKRPIIRTLDIVNEIIKLNGKAPAKIFIEMARDHTGKDKGNRKESRKDRIAEYLKNFPEEKELRSLLESKSEDELRGDKLYLYFMQLGRCMYSGESIDLNALASNAYDIDHIFPQCRIKDDSIDNRVLVKSELNGKKGDVYPIDKDIRKDMKLFWDKLHKNGLVSNTKYERLTRSNGFSDNELADFINRQLVETRRSTKAVAELLRDICPESEIVYVKAGIVSDFRHNFDMLKCRDVNDLHHAKDAYLNIVMGNVHDVKYTKNPLNFIKANKGKQYNYSLKLTSLLEHDIERDGIVAWKKDETIATVRKYMEKNNVRFVKYSYKRKGKLFNQNPERKGFGVVGRKSELSVEKYGGYNNTVAACFVPVKYTTEKNSGLVIMPLEVMYVNKFTADMGFAYEYALKTLKEIVSLKKGENIISIDFPFGTRLIKIDTMFEIDGFRANLVQKSNKGRTLVFAPAVTLILDKGCNDYIKALSIFADKLAKGGRTQPNEKYDKITKEKNIELYDVLLSKLKSNTYSVMFKNVASKFEKGRDVFIELSASDQVKLLLNMVNVMKSGRSGSCDLRLIGDVEKAAIVTLNSDISKLKGYKSIFIIDQSPTGLIERRSENLLTL